MSDREMFKLGPKDMTFMGRPYPIIEKMMQIIDAHNSAVSTPERRFKAEVAEAKDRAGKAYAAICADTERKLMEASHD